jgi:hypothetical protein
MRRKFNRIYIVLIILSFIPLFTNFYLLYLHVKENSLIEKFLTDHKLKNKPLTKETAVEVSNILRHEFNTNRPKWHFLDKNFINDSFLRNSVLDLLKAKEGVCGEGTRVLVKLLIAMGFDATRINLYSNIITRNGHTLVSILLDNKEIFIDSINSSEEFNYIVSHMDINIDRIYIHNILKDTVLQQIDNDIIREDSVFAVTKSFIAYSYQSLPLTRIFRSIGMKVIILNQIRPIKIISYISESIYVVYIILLNITYLLLIWLLYILNFIFVKCIKYFYMIKLKLLLLK